VEVGIARRNPIECYLSHARDQENIDDESSKHALRDARSESIDAEARPRVGLTRS